jgi:uncharacterized protein (TIGR02453 family)
MSEFNGFPKELYTFLSDLKKNNNRDWFNANKDKYIQFAKDPTMAFIGAMKDRLHDISPSYVADTRANGGSMFRIYRDTRFSKDKTPYKTNIGCQFRHSAGKDAHAPGFYLHLQPGENFAGGGIWMPPTPVLAKIREAIDRNPGEWRQIRDYIGKSKYLRFAEGEKYKRPPRGYDADHPFIEDLKLKTYFANRSFTDREVTSRAFIDGIVATFQDLTPLMRFINGALGLSF